MKVVMLSLRPQWCEKIFNGEKTVEVRKTVPNLETPFTVYVYQTKIKFKVKNWQENFQSIVFTPNGGVEEGNGKVIGSFVCDRVTCCQAYCGESGEKHLTNLFWDEVKRTCLTEHEMFDYIVGKGKKEGTGWLWHITEPKLFDKPRELSEFSKFGYKYSGGCCINYDCPNCIDNGWLQPPECKIDGCFLTRPPQSWCYVEV